MAPSNHIAPNNLPDTLPEDFAEWDGKESNSSTTRSAETNGHRVKVEIPAAPERTQFTGLTNPTPPVSERAKFAPAKMATEAELEVDAFLKRLKDVSGEQPQPRRHDAGNGAASNGAASNGLKERPAPIVETRVTVVNPEPAPVVAPKSNGFDMELVQELRSGFKDIDIDEDEPEKKKNWGMILGIAGGAVAVILAVAIPLTMRGKRVDAARITTTAAPTTTTITPSEETTTAKPSPAVAAGSNSSAYGAQQAAKPQTQLVSYNTTPEPAPVSSDDMNQQLTASSQLPQGARNRAPQQEEAPPPSGFVSGMEGSGDNGVSSAFKGQTKTYVRPNAVTVSAGVAGGLLMRKTAPIYPSIAKTARVQGTVVLAATISRAGRIQDLQVISGPAMLRQAAIDAVRTWQYKPYMLDGQPIDVQTTVNVDFTL
jgi:TonB family protein